MAAHEYHFVTHWRVHGTIEEVGRIIGDATSLPLWWPAVYLDVQVLKAGDANGVGTELELYTKGWLPYTLRWQLRVVDVEPMRSVTIASRGDFVGRGIWTFAQDGEWVDVTYEWEIQAEKPLLRRLSPVLKPIFAANHRWAMRTGEESLRLELLRRGAATDEERNRVPPPPPPTTYSPLALLVSIGGAAVLAIGLFRLLIHGMNNRNRRRSDTAFRPRPHRRKS